MCLDGNRLAKEFDFFHAAVHQNAAQAPIPENQPKYAKVYDLYKKLYPANRELFKALAEI